MVSKLGMRPIAKVEPPIITRVKRKVYLRPIRSPNLPNTNAPNGLTINPAAKVASVDSKAAVGLVLGKNWLANTVARLPNM